MVNQQVLRRDERVNRLTEAGHVKRAVFFQEGQKID